MYSDFMFLDRFLFELSCKNTHTHTQTHTHRDSNEYPIVAFSKNATITSVINSIYNTIYIREVIPVSIGDSKRTQSQLHLHLIPIQFIISLLLVLP